MYSFWALCIMATLTGFGFINPGTAYAVFLSAMFIVLAMTELK